MSAAFAAMERLEHGAIANPDEDRMVGHYWLRELGTSRPARPLRERSHPLETRQAIVEFVGQDPQRLEIKPRAGPTGSSDFLVVGHRRFGAGAAICRRTRWARNDDPLTAGTSSTTPTPTASTGCLGRRSIEATLTSTLVMSFPSPAAPPETRNGMLETQSRLPRAGTRFRPARGRDHASGQQARLLSRRSTALPRPASRCGTGSGAGRPRPRSSGCSPRRCRESTSTTLLAGAAAMDVVDARPATHRVGIPRRSWPLAWFHAGDGRGREGHGGPPLQGPPRAVQPVSPATRDGVARQGARPRRQRRAPGHRGLRQQGLDRPARLRAAAARRTVPNFFATFIEVLRDREGDSSIEVETANHRGRFPAAGSCWVPAARFTTTAARR